MIRAQATIVGDRIVVRTMFREIEFEDALLKCKSVPGARFWANEDKSDKYWHYPLSLDTCLALRRAFGTGLQVGLDLAEWYRTEATHAADNTALAGATDATLTRVPAAFSGWLRGYQRAGAAWVAKGYRGAGIVGDTPGLGKTTQVLAGIIEAGITGPVLVVCPKASVRLVWGKEIKKHLPDTPAYLCSGTRAKRTAELARFANDIESERKNHEPERLRIVVVVAEMLRVEMGHPCYTKGGKKVSGMCPQRRSSLTGECGLHTQDYTLFGIYKEEKQVKKDLVPVGFSFPQLFDLYLLREGWSAVVVDESHKLMGSLNVVRGNLMGRGLKLLPYRMVHRRYAMSGTPFGKGGRLEGMFGTLHWLWPDEYTSFWRWAYEVFDVEDKVVDRAGNTVKKITGVKGHKAKYGPSAADDQAWEDFLKSLGPRILRRTKAEVLPDLPPKTILEVPCEMTPAQRKQYKDLAEWLEIRTPGGNVVPNGHLAILTRERQVANGVINKGPDGKVQFTSDSGKLEQLWQALDNRGILDGAPGPKLVIASEFNEYLDVIAQQLNNDKVLFFRLDGSTPDKQREWQVQRWQGNQCEERLFLVNTKAAGISIDLDAADEMHILDEDPDPGVNEQLEDRIHRASRNHKVFIYYYRTEGTVDYQKAHSVEFRRMVQHAVLDGRRGVEYTRDILKEALEGNEDD